MKKRDRNCRAPTKTARHDKRDSATRETKTFSEKLKSWLWIAAWTLGGAMLGAALAYYLFGLAYDSWNATAVQVPVSTPRRSGDPIDDWAQGYVAAMMAIPVVLVGLIAGLFIGFRIGYRRYQKKLRTRVSVGLLLGIALTLSGCDLFFPQEVRVTGGDYEVTHDMLAGAKFTSRTGRDRRYDDLQWVFQDKTFLITAGQNGLPPVLTSLLLPEGVEATTISGKWTVDKDKITFTEIKADGELVDQPPRTLRTMFTGVLRIEAGPQYKFNRGYPK
jgi:hypothetical protein